MTDFLLSQIQSQIFNLYYTQIFSIEIKDPIKLFSKKQ